MNGRVGTKGIADELRAVHIQLPTHWLITLDSFPYKEHHLFAYSTCDCLLGSSLQLSFFDEIVPNSPNSPISQSFQPRVFLSVAKGFLFGLEK